MSFKDLNINIRYRTEEDNIPCDFVIPVLSQAVSYKRASGYFSSTALIKISTGLFEMLKNRQNVMNGQDEAPIRIVCSPELSDEDIEAVNMGYRTREEVFNAVLSTAITDPVDEFEEERLNLIATLIANGCMDLKIAFMEENGEIRHGIFHEKIAVFEDSEGNRISYAGSMNETKSGMLTNFESIYPMRSWGDERERLTNTTTEADFDRLWENTTGKLQIVPFPEIIVEKLKKYKKETINWDTDNRQFDYYMYLKKSLQFHVPNGVKLHDYQDIAVENWKHNHYQGVFDMCTGDGGIIVSSQAKTA